MFCKNCGASLKDDAKFCTQCGTPCESASASAGGPAGRPQPAAKPGAAGAFSLSGQNSGTKLALIVSCAIYFVLALVWIVTVVTEASDLSDLFSIFDEDMAASNTLLFCCYGLLMACMFLSAGLGITKKSHGFTLVEGLTKQDMRISLLGAVAAGVFGIFFVVFQGVVDGWTIGDGGDSYTTYTAFQVYGDLFKYCFIPLVAAIVVQLYAWTRLFPSPDGASRKDDAK